MKNLFLNTILLSIALTSYSYATEGKDSFNITVRSAEAINIVFENDGRLLLNNLNQGEVINEVMNYKVNSANRDLECALSSSGVYYQIGEVIPVSVINLNGQDTGVKLNVTFSSCENGDNNIHLSGLVDERLSANEVYYVDYQMLSVTYTPRTVSSFI
ncbi:MAG: hypothetical protein ISQ32_00245 [Rickettsiales bacterium]|nr:hypothetical protein [Rickettsiales bacterium]